MSLEPKCGNCGKDFSNPGHVYGVFYPFLFLVLAFPGGRFCEPCASTINAVGFFVSFAGIVGFIVWAFWFFGA